MNSRRLFVASCISLITSAFSFMIRQDISDPLSTHFNLTKQDVGSVMAAAFLGMAVSMLLFAPICDFLGMGKVLALAFLCHLTGVLGTIFAPSPPAVEATSSYWILWGATFLVGCGNGLVEVAINPLAATLYPTQKTHYLNILHAWWPGGLIMAGLLAQFGISRNFDAISAAIGPSLAELNPFGARLGLGETAFSLGDRGWTLKMSMMLVPLFTYGILCLGQKFPKSERVAANISTGRMFLEVLNPFFMLWGVCMLLTASSELGPNQWQESVLKRTLNFEGAGTLVFVYTSGLMFVMRFFAGPLAHALSPVGMLMCSSVLAAAGLYWLSFVDSWAMAFAASTVFGIGIAYYWPTMLGVTAERFPKGGALLLGLMGSFGNLAIFFILPQMGAVYDSYTVANIPEAVQKMEVPLPDGKKAPVVLPATSDDSLQWLRTAIPATTPYLPEAGTATLERVLPPRASKELYPAGFEKLNPAVSKLIEEAGKPDAKPVISEKDDASIRVAERAGAAWAFRWVAVLPCILVVIFGLIALVDRLRGGYKAKILITREEENELFAGGVQAPVE